jgi:hypothetical protein
MTTFLVKILTGLLNTAIQALSFFYIGKQNEQNNNQKEQLNSINKANSIRNKLKRDASYADIVRKRFTR